MRRVHSAILLFVVMSLMAFYFLPSNAASGSEGTGQQKQELQTIREEIRRYESALEKRQRDEKTTLELLAKLDREIDISASYLRSVNQDVAQLDRQISTRTLRIAELSKEEQALRELIKRRIVSFYKYRRARDVEILLSSSSLHQISVWLRYQKMIADNDRRNLQALQARQRELERQQNYLRMEKAEKSQKLSERRSEEQQLRSSREKRGIYLTSVRKDKKALEQRLRDSRQSEKQILALIAKAEEARLTQSARKSSVPASASSPGRSGYFANLKGKLVWPASGTIVSRYGRQRHPELNTITENLGIEIRAALGSPVVTVGDGVIQTITWQRGSGNIVIISHDDGYYTVYTHLEEIRVQQDERVRQGQVIGTVGESGSISGPVLHFQIWKNTRNLDPEEWLA